METTWKLILKAASGPAKRMTRDLLATTAAFRALDEASITAQAHLSRFGSAGTTLQIRSVTAAIRDQTKALREINSVAAKQRTVGVRVAPMRVSAGGSRASAARAAPAASAGRTRMDIGNAPAGRTRLDVAAMTGRTRVDVAAMGGRTRAEGPSVGEFQARARALQVAHFQRTQREADRAQQRAARVADRARRVEERQVTAHFQRLSRLTQASFRAQERIAARNGRAMDRARRTRERSASRESAARGGQLVGALGAVGGVGLGLAGAAVGTALAIGGIGLAAARAGVQVLAFRESTLTALTAVTGSSTDAAASFQEAIRIANQTPLDTTQTVAAMTQFRVAGFSAADTRPLLAAFADISAARGDEAGQAFQRVTAQIRGVGRVNRGDIQMQGITAGLNAGDIYDSIARQMNLGTGLTGRRAAENAVSHRRVNNRVGEQAFLDATRRAYDNGGQLGSFAQGGSRTLTGALSNLSNAPTNLLLQLNTMQSPGIIAFKNAILSLTNAFDVSQPAGRAMLATIERVINAVGGLLGRITPASVGSAFATVSSGFAAVSRFGAAAWPIVRAFGAGFGPSFMAATAQLRGVFAALTNGGPASASTLRVLAMAAQGFGRVLGLVVGFTASAVVGVVGLAAALAGTAAAVTGFAAQALGSVGSLASVGRSIALSLLGPVAGIGVSLYNAFTGVGSQIVSGIIAGIRAGATGMVTSITGLGSTAVASIRAALGIHSPSRVFADLVGAQIPAGIAMGVNAHAGVANDAVAGIVNPRLPQLGGGGASVSIEINVSGASQPMETARAVRAELEDALGGIFGQWAEATP
jgi:hypothetical protein